MDPGVQAIPLSPRSPFARTERRSLLLLVLCVLSTRGALALTGYLAVALGKPGIHPRAASDFGRAASIVGWLRWDSWWYVSVVEHGYRSGGGGSSNLAFFPGFPAVMALLTPLFGNAALAGFAAANVSFLAALYVLWDWVRDRAGLHTAERAVACILLYPLSFFLNTGYAEAFYFLVCTLALSRMDRGRYTEAALYTSAAALTRPMGAFLAVAFAGLLVHEWRRGKRPSGAAWLPVILPAAAVCAYAVYLWVRFGSPFAVIAAHRAEGWSVGREFYFFHIPPRKSVLESALDGFQLLLPPVLVYLCVRAFRRFGVVSGVYSGLAALLGLFLGGESIGREALAVIPAFAAAGTVPRVSPAVSATVALAAFVLLLTFAYAFSMGFFMG